MLIAIIYLQISNFLDNPDKIGKYYRIFSHPISFKNFASRYKPKKK
jgi:hypothetical protein